jgi:hypothetical protein
MTHQNSRPFWEPGEAMMPARGADLAAGAAPARYSSWRREQSALDSARGPHLTAGNRDQSPAERNAGQGPEPRRRSPGLARVIWLAAGAGLCLDGLAVAVSPNDYSIGLWLFWPAVVVPFTVFTIVLLAGRPSRALQQVIVALIGLYPAVVYRMSSPLVLGGFDEHLHERTLQDLLHGSGLLSPNPTLPVSPDYPGLELFTGVALRLTGLPVILGISAVVLLCRLLLVLIIYNAALTVTPSRRVASLVVIFYALSPQFFFFNSQFAYQTMALTLGLGGLFLLRRAQLTEGVAARRLTVLAVLTLIATVVTHHVTSWFVLGFLLAWLTVTPARGRRPLKYGFMAMGISVVLWTAGITSKMVTYLGPIFTSSLQQFEALTGGTSQSTLFSNSAGLTEPEWQRASLILYAVICACAAMTCGAILLWRAARYHDSMLGLLGVLTITYPATLAAHFLSAAAGLGDRASTFFFLPLALSCALVFLRDPRVSRPGQSAPHTGGKRSQLGWLVPLIALTVLAYLGGVVLGSGPDWQYLRGPYMVSAESRTQDPETLAAVTWAASHLPAGSRIVADRIPADLLASEARMWPITSPSRDLQPASLYFSGTWDSYLTTIVRQMDIRYLYIDRRLSESFPQEGYYIYPGETPKPERISSAALAKFAHVPGLKAVYDHGPVIIYDTAHLGTGPETDGFTGDRSMGAGTLGDGLLGAAAMAGAFALRRRLRWLKNAALDVGALGVGLAFMAVVVLAGGALFGLLIMPGPSFTAGALLTAIVGLVMQRRRPGLHMSARGIPYPPDPLAVIGVLACIAGLAIGFHAAWVTDVTAVNNILRSASGAGRP